MQPDPKNTTPEFPPDELLIFIGHSDDASAEADAILELKAEIEREFRLLLTSNNHRSSFRRWKFWEWREDALPIPGGQDVVVTNALNRADIAIFVFRERVGTVTWQELERARQNIRQKPLYILTFFPASPPDLKKLCDIPMAVDWLKLLERQKELTSDWTSTDSCSVTPCPPYKDIEALKSIVCDKVRVAMAHILAVDSPILLNLYGSYSPPLAA